MTDKKIILIEDDHNIIEMYKIRLEGAGFKLSIASDGESGLDLAKSQPADLILLDVMMPKMDGFAVLSRLKQDDKTKNIPVLLLTNLGQKADMEKGKAMGANDYIVKSSLTPSQVLEKINLHLKNK